MFQKIAYRISILVVACIFIVSLGGKASANSFSDIPSLYSKEINYLLDKEVINGYPDKTFRPRVNVTREEAVTMVGRALGYDGTQRASDYVDVKPESYASGYIQSALEKGIISNNPDQKFRPKDNMTRGEMAYLLQNAFNLTETGVVTISDVNQIGTLYEAVNAIVTAGLANGYPDGTFKPDNPMTRTEFSLFVARGLNEDFRVHSEAGEIDTATVNADFLNVRTGPGTTYEVMDQLANGTQVTIHQYLDDWAHISTDTVTGYVNRKYLKLASSSTGEKIIAIDAGHGGKDPGAIGNGLQEKEVNLAVALKVEKLLKQHDIKVVMTRSDDTFLELNQRVDVAVQNQADTFVSIHANKFKDGSANGTETYFSTAALSERAANSKQLATFIQERLYQALGTKNRGVKEAKFVVIHKNPLPATLVELGFISNQNDASKLGSEEYRNKAAEAIALGIVDYYNWRQ